MAKTVKELLKDVTDRFKNVSGTSEQQIRNMEANIKAAQQAAKAAKSEKV